VLLNKFLTFGKTEFYYTVKLRPIS